MKSKICFLLSLFLMTVLGTVSSFADTGDVITSLDQIDVTKCYTIAAPRGGLVLNGDKTGVVSAKKSNATVDNPNASTEAGADQWVLVPDGDEGYYLYNVNNGKVLNSDGTMSNRLSESLELMLTGSPNGNYVFKIRKGNTTLNNNNQGGFYLDGWNSEDNGNCLTIVEAGTFDAVDFTDLPDVTFYVLDGEDNVVATEMFENCFPGATYTSQYAAIPGITLDTPSFTAPVADSTITSSYTFDDSAFPFKLSQSATSGTSWYLLKVNRATPKYCTFDGTSIKTSTSLTETSFSKETAFCFVGTPFGFRIVNAAHKDQAFGPKTTSGSATLVSGSVDDAATFMFENSTVSGYESYQLLRNTTDPLGYVNDVNGELAYWIDAANRTDAGSNISFIEIEFPTDFTVDGIKYLVNSDKQSVTVTYPTDAEPSASNRNTYAGDIVIPESVTYGGFDYNVTAIGRAAFARSSITSLVIGDNVTETGYDCCAYTSTLSKVVIGSGVTSMKQGFAFSCGNMKDVTIKATTPPTAGAYMFSGSPTISVKITSLAAYKAAANLSGYTYVGSAEGFDFTYDELQALAATYDGKYTAGDAPGFMSQASVDAVQNAVDAAKNLSEDAATEDINAAVQTLTDAVNGIKAVDFEEGKLYYVVTAGNGKGYSGGPYNYENKAALYNADGYVSWKAWDKEDRSQMYRFTSNGNGKWYLYCLGDNTYIEKGEGSYNCKVTTSATPANAQAFTLVGDYNGKFAITGSDANVYTMAAGHNGSSAASGYLNMWGNVSEAKTYGVNQWFVTPVADDIAELIAAKDSLLAYYNEVSENYAKMSDPTYDDAALTADGLTALGKSLDECKALLGGTGTTAQYTACLTSLREQYESCPFIEGGRKSSAMAVSGITDGSKIILGVGHTAYSGRYMVAYPDNANQNSVKCDDTDKSLATVWQLEATGSNDAIYTGKPTYYMKDLASGKYLGATSTTSIDPNDKRMVDGTDNAYAFSFLTKEEIKDKENVDIDTYETANPVFIQHSNADGTWLRLSRFGGNAYVYYISSSVYPDNKDWQAWELYSGNSNYTISEEMEDVLAEYGGTTFPNTGSDPGCFDAALTEPFTKAVAAAKAITAANSRKEYREAIDLVKSTYAVAKAATVNPVVEGYYYIESAWTSKAGQNIVAYDPNDGKGILANHANANSAYDIFHLTVLGDGQYALQNLGSGLYVGQAQEDNSVSLVESMTDGVYQTFTYDADGQFKWADNKTGFTYYIFNDVVGRYYKQLTGGFDAWYLRTVPKEVVDEILHPVEANYYEIASEPSAPEAGKTYAIKSVANGLYATSRGAESKAFVLDNSAVWSIEATGSTVDTDTPTYWLKSVAADGYWQVDDFTTGAKEGSPFDGFDVYGYKGLNATFGSTGNAQAFTVLPSTAYSADETRSSVGEGKTPTGYVIATVDKVTSGTFSKYYKLDTQRGNNVALTPWLADVDWLFYEAVKGTDISRELEIAIETYGIDTEAAATGDDPGYYSAASLEAYAAALSAAKALTSESSKADIRQAIDNLAAAYAAATSVNPIVEGYYTIVSAGKGSGYPASDEVKYDDEDRFALYNADGTVKWKTYDESLYEEIYYLSPAADGNWYARSLADNTYIDKGAAAYACSVLTSAEAGAAQVFTPSSVAGKFTLNSTASIYAYALTSSHNGANGNTEGSLNIWGTTSEANGCKMNLWYLHKVSDATVAAAKESIAAGLGDLIAEVEGKGLEGSDRPGYYSKSNVDALNAALTAAKAVSEGSADEKIAASNTLKAAYAKTVSELNPITEGYYYIVSRYQAYKDKFGAPAALYIAPDDKFESGNARVRFETFDGTNANFIFKLTPKEGVDGAFYARSEYSGLYLNTGEGSSWYGEVTNASSEATNAQLFSNYGVGQYWIADETDTRVSRCVRKTGVRNGTVYGWTQIGDDVSEADLGYNAWELVPVSEADAAACCSAQAAKDADAQSGYGELDSYVSSVQSTYDSYVSDESGLSSSIKESLKSAYKAYTDAKDATAYDISTTKSGYQTLMDNLKSLMEAARLELSGVDGIAGGSGSVTGGQGGVTVTASADMTVTVVSSGGRVVARRSLRAGETLTVSLTPGVYVVNGTKVLVK